MKDEMLSMNNTDRHVGLRLAILVFVCLLSCPALAQFNSGSTGALGALAPGANTTVVLPADGILNYTTVTIPSGVTVTFQRNNSNTPVMLLAQGDISISGTINLDGDNAAPASASGSAVIPGSVGGPGGFTGGEGGLKGITNANGTPGQGAGGGSGGRLPSVTTVDGIYGAASNFVALIPLFGGSGGGSGAGDTTVWGASGAGGGGAIVIASSTQITIATTGVIRANGGAANYAYTGSCNWFTGGAGSGGAIRLVSPQVTNQGTIQALGGNPGCTPVTSVGGPGRIRIECATCTLTGTTSPAASTSTTLGPVAPASTPPLTNLPTLTISSVGGIAAPSSPTGSYTTADVTLPANTTNPVSVTLTATNVPIGTTFIVKILPEGAVDVPFTSTQASGTFASSTATAQVNLPYGRTSLLYAYASFTQVASLFPVIDGEPVDQVMVAAVYGEPSTLSLVTRSGKVVPVTRLPLENQIQVARGWEAMQTSHR